MYSSKALTRPQPTSTEAPRASRVAARGRAYLEFDDNGRPIAANIQSPSDAELLDFIQRALDGDPYPVSGRAWPASSDAIDAEPLTSRIRNILQSGSAADPVALEPDVRALPIADELPSLSQADRIDISLPVEAEPAAVKGDPRRRWVFGFGSIATVIGCALAGALIPTLLAPPPHYRSQTVLQLQGEGVEREALLEVTAKRITSASLLSRTVAKLKLDRDPEFTGEKAGAFGVAMDLLSGSGSASDAPSRAQAALRGDIAVVTDAATGTLRLSVISEAAAKSADIANRLADAAIYDVTVAQSAGGSAANRGAADTTRVAYEQAKAALAAFEAQTGDDKIKAAVELQRQQQQLDADIKTAETDVQAAKARVTAAKSTTLANVLGGAVSSDLSSSGLDDLRSRYVAAKTGLSQLSTQLGPRHPRLLAQQATIDGLTANIRDQLQRLVATSDAELKSALDKRNALSGRMTALSQKKSDVDMTRFAQLQAAVATAQDEYEASLRNSTAADSSEIEVPIAVVSSAIATSAPLDDDLIGMQAAGFLLGLGGAFCLVFLRKWITDVTMPDEPAAEHLPTAPAATYRDEPMLPVQPFDEPPPHSNTAAAVEDCGAVVDDEMAHIRDAMASLRAKVETYALRRHVAQP